MLTYRVESRIGQALFHFRGFVETPEDGTVAAIRYSTGPLLAYDVRGLRRHAELLVQIADTLESGHLLDATPKSEIPAEEFLSLDSVFRVP